MPLAPGTRIGSYEIVGPLGAGGMGEVYRARDAKLGRDAAIKILPDAFLNDADRVARFEREARTLASLNHPNIAQIYGMEDRALVMELVEGEDLSAILARGPVPLADALPIARQIAHALEAAHELGIVHRDLKPANVKVKADGTVKVLDFGLARSGAAGGDGSGVSLEHSPTMTSPATTMGMILGTAAYMSPEQARGKVVDRRADVWAFGVVLYEMLSGRRAFQGNEITDVLASVLKDTVPLQDVPAETPPSIRRLLRRCLQKDRSDRLDSMAAARLEIADAIGGNDEGVVTATGPVATKRGWRSIAIPDAAAVFGMAAAGLLVWQAMQPTSLQPTRLALAPPANGAVLININQPDLALSPDGRRMAYASGEPGSTLVMRSLDGFAEQAFPAIGELPRSPFFSADGRWLGYFAAASSGREARLMKLPAEGGAPQEIARVPGNLRGASWSRENVIIFGTNAFNTGLMRVGADGGTPEVLTTPDAKSGEVDHVWPFVLPGGKQVLFTITRRGAGGPMIGEMDVAVLDLGARTWRVIQPAASYPKYVAGHLLYVNDHGLFAVPFDPDAAQLRGEPVSVIDDVLFKATTGASDVDVSESGTVVYVAGSIQDRSTLHWVDRSGQIRAVTAPPRPYQSVRISPDGRRAVVGIVESGGYDSIWIHDFEREMLTRLSPAGEMGGMATWSVDGRDVFYRGSQSGKRGIFRIAANGAGAAELVIERPDAYDLAPTSNVPGGKAIVVTSTSPQGAQEIQLLALDGSRTLTPLLVGGGSDSTGRISLDGRWIAYASTESGRPEVFLRPFPDVRADKIPVSSGGGVQPAWTPDGRALVFQDLNDQIWMVEVGSAAGSVGKPQRVAQPESARFAPGFDVSRDRSLLRIQRQPTSESSSQLRIILNWFEALHEKMRAAK